LTHRRIAPILLHPAAPIDPSPSLGRAPVDLGQHQDAALPLAAGDAVGLARFLHRVGRLKRTPRTGWLDRGVPAEQTESVADHSFRVAVLAWLAAQVADAKLDPDRVLALALLHDVSEALTGDLPPYDPAAIAAAPDDATRRAFLDGRHVRAPDHAAAKRAAEAAAMTDLLADLPAALATALERLWGEWVTGVTAEARFVKQADKLETFLQSREYLAADPTRPMASFAAEVAEVVDHPTLVELRRAIADLAPDPPPP
jgi:putative hydrolase of HD superfamily